MGPEQPGQAVPIPAAGAVPKPAPPEQLNLEAGKHQANQEMADAEVTEEQLAESNEPRVPAGAWPTRRPRPRTPTPRPGSSAQQEQQVIAQGKADAAAETTAGVAGMQGAKGAALAKLVADKGKTKSKDEAKRAEVTAKIQAIFAATETDVKKILDGIDPKVEKEFEQGEAAARPTFESTSRRRCRPTRRTGTAAGSAAALGQGQALGMPDKVNEFYEAGRELYLKQMDGVISRVADIVGDDLTAAKKRIADGQDRDRHVREEPARRTCRRSARRRRRRSATSSSSSRATSTPSRSRSSTPWPPSTSRRARASTSGSRSCRPRTRAWSTRRSARSRPSSTRSASSPRC